MQRADSYVTLSEDGWYYFTASVPEYDKIVLRRAKIEGNPLYNPNRHAMLMKIKWDEKGYPVFSYNK